MTSLNEQSMENIQLDSSKTSLTISLPASARLRSLILKKHLSTLFTQLKNENNADPNLTRMILLNIFQMFNINKINFLQYLHLHNHPDSMDKPTYKCDQMTQTDHTTIKPKPLARNLSNRSRTALEKQNINTYWPSDDNDSTDDEL